MLLKKANDAACALQQLMQPQPLSIAKTLNFQPTYANKKSKLTHDTCSTICIYAQYVLLAEWEPLVMHTNQQRVVHDALVTKKINVTKKCSMELGAGLCIKVQLQSIHTKNKAARQDTKCSA